MNTNIKTNQQFREFLITKMNTGIENLRCNIKTEKNLALMRLFICSKQFLETNDLRFYNKITHYMNEFLYESENVKKDGDYLNDANFLRDLFKMFEYYKERMNSIN